MNQSTMDTITSRAATVTSRRSSLLAMGGAALFAVLVAPAVGKAGKAGKKAKKQTKKRCANQVQQCQDSLIELCGADECGGFLDDALLCCESFRDCNAGAAIACFFPDESPE